MLTMVRIESKLDQVQYLQNIVEAVRKIQQTLKKCETRWNALIRSIKQFISLVD